MVNVNARRMGATTSCGRGLRISTHWNKFTLQYWAQRWQDEQLLGEEERTLTSNIYFKNELLLMLRQAGFDDVAVQGDFLEVEATPEHGDLVFIARKTPLP